MSRLILLFLCWTIAAAAALLSLGGCRDATTQSEMHRWDLIAEGENKELYFLDRKAITRVSDGVVRVSVKYVPSKDQFLISLKEISKQFGGEGKEADYEYTVSTWEFDCAKGDGRCLSLTPYASPGWRMASSITASLRQIDPSDPVKYDFALCHLGMQGLCGFTTPAGDSRCPLRGVCRPRARRRRGSRRSSDPR